MISATYNIDRQSSVSEVHRRGVRRLQQVGPGYSVEGAKLSMKSSAPCLYGLKPGESPRCYEEVHQASGYCKKHQKEPFKGSTYRESRPANWRNLVASVLRRDKSICYVCGEPGADSADHVKPRHLGGTDALHNLKAIHQNVPPYCHRTKTAQEANEQRRKMNTGLKRNRATLYN